MRLLNDEDSLLSGGLALLHDPVGESTAAGTIRLNLSHAGPEAAERLDGVLGEAFAEAAAGRWREPVAELLESKGTGRALRVAALMRERR